MTQELAIFASRFNVSVEDAYVLPALFERAAEMAQMPLRSFIAEATFRNNPLGECLANAARKVAQECRRELREEHG